MKKSFLKWFTDQLPIKYIAGIIKDAHYWQKHSLVDFLETQPKEKIFYSFKKNIITHSHTANCITKRWTNKDFAGYAIASLSIFIGLNINLIIMMFDKFNSIDFKTENKTIKEKISIVKKGSFSNNSRHLPLTRYYYQFFL